MFQKKFLISTVVVFVAAMLTGFVVHELLLGADYLEFSSLYRGEEGHKEMFPFMLIGHLLLAGAIVWLYSKGKDSSAWIGQGIRFGIGIAVVHAISVEVIYYAIMPISMTLMLKQVVFDGARLVLLGILTAWLDRK